MNSQYIDEYKGYQIKPHKEHPKSYVIVTSGKGGKIPNLMDGLFTSRSIAKSVIDGYVETQQPKEPLNGESVQKSRGK